MLVMLNMTAIQSKTVKSEEENQMVKKFLERKFRNSRSFETIKGYQSAINRLQEFARQEKNMTLVQLVHSIKSGQLDPIDVLDEHYTFLSNYKRKKSTKVGFRRSSMSTYIDIAKELLRSENIRIYNEDVRQKLRLRGSEDIYEEGLSKGLINSVIRAAPLKLATAILMFASSSMALGELTQLRLTDIDFSTNPTTIQIRKETTKGRPHRFTHISTEATNALKDYLAKSFGWTEQYKEDKYPFMETHEERIARHEKRLERTDLAKINRVNLENRIKKLKLELENLSPEEIHFKDVRNGKARLYEMLSYVLSCVPDLAMKNVDNGRKRIHFHAFRSWFKTQVSEQQQGDFAEALMGHKSLRLGYFRQHHENRERLYLQVEHALTIADTDKVDKVLAHQQEDLQDLRVEYKDVKKENRDIKRDLVNIQEKLDVILPYFEEICKNLQVVKQAANPS